MTPFEAVMIAEGAQPADSEKHYVQAWQLLIDTGMAWQLQGWFGRTAMAMIEDGICTVEEDTTEDQDPEYCDCCECTPCDCDWGTNE